MTTRYRRDRAMGIDLGALMRKTESVSRRVLFVYNDPSAPEALLGEVFTESGFQITTFEVVPPPHRRPEGRGHLSRPHPLRRDRATGVPVAGLRRDTAVGGK